MSFPYNPGAVMEMTPEKRDDCGKTAQIGTLNRFHIYPQRDDLEPGDTEMDEKESYRGQGGQL